LEKERKEETTQRAGRFDIIRLKMKVDMMLSKGKTIDAGKWNNTDLKVMLHWFKYKGGNTMPNNKDGLLADIHKAYITQNLSHHWCNGAPSTL
jgi:hypothetical protein